MTNLPLSEKVTEKILEEAKEKYGFCLDQRQKENLKWMKENGYLTTKRNRTGKPGRPR